MNDKLILLEYNERQGFHYNNMERPSGQYGWYAVSLCSVGLANRFTDSVPEHNGTAYPEQNGIAYEDVCRRWAEFCKANADEFRKIGLR